MKIKSKGSFLDAVQAERAWRRKELTNIKSLVHQAKESHTDTLLRAGILLIYSHWEGYIKKVCEAFFHYLNFKSLKYCELKDNFKAIGITSEFDNFFPHKKFNSYLKTVEFLKLGVLDKKFTIDVEKKIDTQSNLNTDVLKDLLNMVGVDTHHFEQNKHHIDNRLLKYRNAISHGERTDNNPDYKIDMEGFNDLYERINKLTDAFETLVMNHIELETYKI